MNDKELNKKIMILPILAIILSVLGATFAYFQSSVTGSSNVNALSYKFDVTLNVALVNPSTAPSKGYDLIPIDEANIGTAITNNCIDSNGYAACRIYELTFTNNSGQAVTLNGTLTPSSNNFANLKYSVTTVGGAKSSLTAGNALPNAPVTTGFQNLTIPTGTSKMYIMLYVNNLNANQPNDQGKTFSGTLTLVDSTGGNQLYAQFGPNYVYTGYNGQNARIGQSISVTTYQSPEAAMAALKAAGDGTTNYPFFLAHVLGANDNVSESYVGFVVTDDMARDNTGMTAGTYYLKGGDNGAAYNDNKTVLTTAFGSNTNYCEELNNDGVNITGCNVSGLLAVVGDDGLIQVDYLGGHNCYVDGAGSSYCALN